MHSVKVWLNNSWYTLGDNLPQETAERLCKYLYTEEIRPMNEIRVEPVITR